MPTLCWRLGYRRALGGPRLGEQRFGGGIDEGHLTRRLRGALRIAHESIGVMLAGELSARGANLIGACAEWHAENLVRCAAPRH
jgi:hypothetical protein